MNTQQHQDPEHGHDENPIAKAWLENPHAREEFVRTVLFGNYRSQLINQMSAIERRRACLSS
jgi:hypothetical protein